MTGARAGLAVVACLGATAAFGACSQTQAEFRWDGGAARFAVEVLEILPPDTEETAPIEDLGDSDAATIAALPLEPARVKWFDKVKGFGFANVYGRPEDVFIHIEVLRRSGFADLQPGEAVSLRAIDGSRGRMAVLVASWDAVLQHRDDH